MTPAGWRAVATVFLLMAVVACDQPEPPEVALHVPSLDTGDLAVIRGVLDDLRARGGGRRRFMVVDTTTAVCERRVDVFGAPPGGCLAPELLRDVSKVLPSASRRTAAADFEARNARRLPIGTELGPDITYVSATLTDIVSMNDLMRQNAGSSVVTFSAPSYPAQGVAVVFYRVKDDEHAVVRLDQNRDGRWRVADRYGAIE